MAQCGLRWVATPRMAQLRVLVVGWSRIVKVIKPGEHHAGSGGCDGARGDGVLDVMLRVYDVLAF